jgi:hypothetical protein
MHRKTLAPLLVLTIASTLAACGDSFTEAPSDGGPSGDDTLESGTLDGATKNDAMAPDGSISDAAGPGDSGVADASPPPSDGGGGVDAAGCGRACPSGFDCVASKCIDTAASRFSTNKNPPFLSNWTYGYASAPGQKPNVYSQEWKATGMTANGGIDVWSKDQGNIELSVFHNPGLVEADYLDLAVPALALGLYPTTSSTEVTAARWVAPANGTYDLDALFTGISTPPAKVAVGVSLNGTVGTPVGMMPTSGFLNQFGSPNSFHLTVTGQVLKVGDTVDFYVTGPTALDDSPGGVTLKATITAE